MTASPPLPPPVARGLSGYPLVWLMCGSQILCLTGFATFPALLPQLLPAWSLTNAQAGWISGTQFGAYILAVPILTAMTDRIDARRIYLRSTLVAAAGALVMAFLADGFWLAMLGQMLCGIALAGLYMPGLKALTDRVDDALRPRAVALYTACGGAGLAVSLAAAGWLSALFGWQWAFFAPAPLSLLAGLLIWLLLPPKRPAGDGRREYIWPPFGRVLGNRHALGYMLAYLTHSWELFALRSWLVAFLVYALSRFGNGPVPLSATELAGLLSLLGIVTSLGGNELALRFGRRRTILWIMASTLAVATALGFSAAAPDSATMATVTIVLAALYFGLVYADSAALTAGTVQAAAPELRGATLAVHSTFGFGAGLLSPLAVGLALDLTGGTMAGAGWLAGMAAVALPGIAGMLAILLLTRDAREVE